MVAHDLWFFTFSAGSRRPEFLREPVSPESFFISHIMLHSLSKHVPCQPQYPVFANNKGRMLAASGMEKGRFPEFHSMVSEADSIPSGRRSTARRKATTSRLSSLRYSRLGNLCTATGPCAAPDSTGKYPGQAKSKIETGKTPMVGTANIGQLQDDDGFHVSLWHIHGRR